MPGPASPSSGATGPGLAQRFDAELADLGVEDTELVPDLRAHVLAAIDAASGPEPQQTLSVDQAAAVAFSVLTGVTSLAGPESDADAGADPRRARAVQRAEELAGLQAELAERRATDVASTSARQLVGLVLRRRPSRRSRGKHREEAG